MFSWFTNEPVAADAESAQNVESRCEHRRSSVIPNMTGAPVRTEDGVMPFDYVKRNDGVIVWYPRGTQIDEAELNAFVEENRAGASHEEITDEKREFFKQTKDTETHMIYFPRKEKTIIPAPAPAPTPAPTPAPVMAAPRPAPRAVVPAVTCRPAAPQLYVVQQTQPQYYYVVPDCVQYYLPVTSLQVQTSEQYYYVPQTAQYYAVAPTTTQEFVVQPTQRMEYVAGASPSVVYDPMTKRWWQVADKSVNGMVPSSAVCYVK
eukprot:GEMP01064774.1.p1 GENE.GEMP01064774.1~~GEMP01064774.1.p1  ORF type:complete len:262 (+),score=58.14 GEMP01064774.1:38-823(+)